jgi:glycyl-tRNA synthetase alpha chain
MLLQQFWMKHDCAIMQPYDVEMGAGTFHPATTLRCLGPKRWRAAYVQPSRRPKDGRYGENPNRLHQHHQFQVILKPSPENLQDLYLQSLAHIGIDFKLNDIRFVEDDWESPTLGAWGLGWEVWCNGMEVSQFTYMQQIGGLECELVSGELTYGLERLIMYIQGVENVYDLDYNGASGGDKITYKDVFLQSEQEFSAYSLEYANTKILLNHFIDCESECSSLIEKNLSLPAYEQCLKASHIFNLLDSRGVISVTERASYIAKVRSMAKACCVKWLESGVKNG